MWGWLILLAACVLNAIIVQRAYRSGIADGKESARLSGEIDANKRQIARYEAIYGPMEDE